MSARIVRHLAIHGRVQGVGYRYAMRSQADIEGVTGWVRNRRDGTVEATVAGEAAAVERLVAWARIGPPGSAVTQVDVTETAGEFASFDMLATA